MSCLIHVQWVYIRLRDNEIRTAHAPIVGEKGLVDIAGFISRFCGVPERGDDSITVGRSTLHLPPVIFGSDILDIEHPESGHVVYFSARVFSTLSLTNVRVKCNNAPFRMLWHAGLTNILLNHTSQRLLRCPMLKSGLSGIKLLSGTPSHQALLN